MTGDTLEVLQTARALIDQPEHWCQRALAKNAQGETIDPDDLLSESVVRLCASGAIGKASQQRQWSRHPAFRVLKAYCEGDVVSFNDRHTHAEVLTAFNKAIAHLEAS